MEIVIATRNLHKMREFREMLKALPTVDVLSLHDFPHYSLPNFKLETFEERAAAKATHAAKELKRVVIGDDSGLVIPTLGGAPGSLSSTYAGEAATDGENCRKVLHELGGKVDLDRAAYMVCSLTLADADGIKKSVTGTVEGEIIEESRGRNGTGYDSIFRKLDYDKTFSELDENIRVRISHRRKAFEKLVLYLETVCR